jgi:hypothetical protein
MTPTLTLSPRAVRRWHALLLAGMLLNVAVLVRAWRVSHAPQAVTHELARL